jgi:phenylacetate-CoA ligase
MPSTNLRTRIRDRVCRHLPLPFYYGRDFRRIYAFLLKTRHWDSERIEKFKLDRIRALLAHAQQNVSYYRDLFGELHLDWRDIKTLADFARIPILTKDSLRNRLEDLKADNFDSYQPLHTQTSGTTSSMTLVYRSRYHEAFRKAQLWRFWNEYGYNFRDRRVNIVCRSFDPKSPVCEYDRLENCLLVNTYHIIRGCRDEILEAIRDFRPKLIWTHSSPLGILAEHVVSKGLPPFDVPIVATYAEKIYPHIRNILQQAFPARYIEYFANRENSFASWGESDDKFYEVSEYCHLEVDRRWGDGVTGDLITTGLHNYAVPLIRYDPGDIVKWHGFTNPEVPYPVIELLGGRGKDILVSRDGLTVPYFLAYIDSKKFNKLIKYQIEQLNIDEVILRVVPRQNFDRERDEALLLHYASESFANKFRIRLEYVDDIPLTEGGKYRSVISKLAIKHFDQPRRS